MKQLLVILMLSLSACAKHSDSSPESCSPLASAYEVEYPDGQIRKSGVASCGDSFTANALDQSGDSFETKILIIQLKDAKTGQEYLTQFSGE